MSESTFPFGAPAEPEPLLEDTAEGESRKPLLLVGGLVGALVLGAGAFLLLGGGGETEDEFALASPSNPVAEAPATAPEAVEVIPAASTDAVGRNPFKARYIAPVEAPAAVEASTVDPAALPLALPQQPVQVTIQQPAPAPATTSTTPAEQAPAQYKLTLVAISEPQPEARTVTWKFEDQEVKVLPGQRFGKYGELVVLAFTTDEGNKVTGAILQVGDATPFDAKVGQTYDVL